MPLIGTNQHFYFTPEVTPSESFCAPPPPPINLISYSFNIGTRPPKMAKITATAKLVGVDLCFTLLPNLYFHTQPPPPGNKFYTKLVRVPQPSHSIHTHTHLISQRQSTSFTGLMRLISSRPTTRNLRLLF